MSAQKKKTLIIVCAAVVLVAAMLAVWFAFGPKGTAGQKAIGVTVVYADATTDEFSFSTDAEFLRQALEEQKLVEGEESQYGGGTAREFHPLPRKCAAQYAIVYATVYRTGTFFASPFGSVRKTYLRYRRS